MGAEGAKMYSEIQKRPYLSGQWTEQSLCDGAIAYHMSLTFTGVFLYTPVFCIQKPRHCGGVKKSLSGEQRKEAPNVIIY